MKVKYWKSSNILVASKANFELSLSTRIGNDKCILYDPLDILHFLDSSFLSAAVKTALNYDQMLQVYLYPSCKVLCLTSIGLS